MKRTHPITTLFFDVGGVLLNDGWDHRARGRAATAFKLEWAEIEARHRLTVETYEDGKLTLEGYWIWWSSSAGDRSAGQRFGRFMFAQSKPFPQTIELVAQLKVGTGRRSPSPGKSSP